MNRNSARTRFALVPLSPTLGHLRPIPRPRFTGIGFTPTPIAVAPPIYSARHRRTDVVPADVVPTKYKGKHRV